MIHDAVLDDAISMHLLKRRVGVFVFEDVRNLSSNSVGILGALPVKDSARQRQVGLSLPVVFKERA